MIRKLAPLALGSALAVSASLATTVSARAQTIIVSAPPPVVFVRPTPCTFCGSQNTLRPKVDKIPQTGQKVPFHGKCLNCSALIRSNPHSRAHRGEFAIPKANGQYDPSVVITTPKAEEPYWVTDPITGTQTLVTPPA